MAIAAHITVQQSQHSCWCAQIKQDLGISDEQVAYKEVVDYMKVSQQHIALNLLTQRVPLESSVRVKTCTVESTRHMRLSWFPLLPNVSALAGVPFSVESYAHGGLMLVQGETLVDQPALSQAVGELKKWSTAAGIVCTSDLCHVEEHDSKQALLVHAAEARLESKLGQLATAIAARHAQVRPSRLPYIDASRASRRVRIARIPLP